MGQFPHLPRPPVDGYYQVLFRLGLHGNVGEDDVPGGQDGQASGGIVGQKEVRLGKVEIGDGQGLAVRNTLNRCIGNGKRGHTVPGRY